MNVEQLKREAAALGDKAQAELAAFIISLRNSRDPDYGAAMQHRIEDKDPARWLTTEEFEKRLGPG